MLPEDTEGKITGLAMETNCKIETSAAANVMPISSYRKSCPAVFDVSGNALDKFSKEWTTLRVYRGGIIKQFRKGMIKCKWNYQKWVLLFYIVDAESQTLARVEDPETNGDIQQTSQSVCLDHWPPLHESSTGQQTT